ncbi:MAG: L,D-transpeptidase [Clostridiaceae bacterium]
MKKPGMLRNLGIVFILLVGIVSAVAVKFVMKNVNYDKKLKIADGYFAIMDYGEASLAYKECILIKESDEISKKLEEAERLDKLKQIYDEGMELIENKEYLGAIEELNKVEGYADVEEKIVLAKTLYIEDYINKSKDSASRENYDKAIEYVNNISALDNNNEEAKKLLDEYSNLKQEKQDEIDKYSGATSYFIEVSLKNQNVRIYQNGELIKDMICSSGKADYDTPTGIFNIQERGESFYSNEFEQGALYWVRFYGEFLFHSLAVDINGNIIEEEAAKLGNPASHGCIRLEVENAKWIYDNIPVDTFVKIY